MDQRQKQKIRDSILSPRRRQTIERTRQQLRRNAPVTRVKAFDRLVTPHLSDPYLFDLHMDKIPLAMIIAINNNMQYRATTRRRCLEAIHLMMDTCGIDLNDIKKFKE
jgi:hypothetical protein